MKTYSRSKSCMTCWSFCLRMKEGTCTSSFVVGGLVVVVVVVVVMFDGGRGGGLSLDGVWDEVGDDEGSEEEVVF